MGCPAGHCPRISLANSFSTKLHKCLRYSSTQSSCPVWRSVCHKAAQPCVHVIQHYSWPLHLVPLCASAGQAYLSCVCACCLSFMQKQLRLAVLLHACFITLLSRIIATLSHSMHLELLMPCIMHSSIAWLNAMCAHNPMVSAPYLALHSGSVLCYILLLTSCFH